MTVIVEVLRSSTVCEDTEPFKDVPHNGNQNSAVRGGKMYQNGCKQGRDRNLQQAEVTDK